MLNITVYSDPRILTTGLTTYKKLFIHKLIKKILRITDLSDFVERKKVSFSSRQCHEADRLRFVLI
jgi:hypothetical protein